MEILTYAHKFTFLANAKPPLTNRKNKFRLEKHSLEVAPTTLLLTSTYSYQLRSAFQPPKMNCFSKFHFHFHQEKREDVCFPFDLELWSMTFTYELDLVCQFVRQLSSDHTQTHTAVDWLSRVYRPTKIIIGHIGGEFLWVKWPNQQCQSTERSSGSKDLASVPPSPSHHVTIL